jgi:endonuclease III
MASTTNKQQALTQLVIGLKKHFDPAPPRELPVLEQLIYGVLRECTTVDLADQAFKNLTLRFFDWNEIRVSMPSEVEESLVDLPDAAGKAERVVGILQEVFEKFFAFKIDEIDKKGLKNAARKLQEMKDVTEFTVAWVVQRSLGGHAIPLDAPSLRVLHRLGMIEDETESLDSLRATLEHYVPKAKGPMFADALAQVGKDSCWEEDPHCSRCPLRGECPTGQLRKHTEPRAPRKPR